MPSQEGATARILLRQARPGYIMHCTQDRDTMNPRRKAQCGSYDEHAEGTMAARKAQCIRRKHNRVRDRNVKEAR